MKRLFIIGAGGFGREVLTLAIESYGYQREWMIAGFLDSRKEILNEFSASYESLPYPAPASEQTRARYAMNHGIAGDPLTYEVQSDDLFVCALGDPVQRRKYTKNILRQGGQFIRLVHELAAPSAHSSIAPGCILAPHATLSPNARLGHFVTVSNFTAIAHDVSVGDWTSIGAHCMVAGNARIGEGVQIHPDSIITAKAVIGDGAVVAAGSVVFGKIPAGITVMGNPAKRFCWS